MPLIKEEDAKLLANMFPPWALYDALLESLGMKEEFNDYNHYSKLEGNEILIYSDTSYHGSPSYEVVNKKHLEPNQAEAIRILTDDNLKKTIKKASYEVEKQRLEEEMERVKRALENCNSALQE